jgi:hypothetical protein
VALAIDGSSPAIATQANGTVATVTTASFTPPAGSTLLILWAGDAAGAPSAPTITDNLGVHLTYTRTDWQSIADSPTAHGQAAAWTAPVGTSAAMTVTVTSGSASGERCAAMAVLVITGADAVTPVGAHGKSGSLSAAAIAQNYTAAATSGWGFVGDNDFDQVGAQTAGTGCTLIGSANVSTAITYGFVRRTSADDVNGGSNTLNVTLPGTSTNLSWVYVEIVPATGSSGLAGPPPLVVPASRQMPRVYPVAIAPAMGPPQAIRLPQIAVVQNPRVVPGPLPIAATPPLLPPQAIAAQVTVAVQALIPAPRIPAVSPPQMSSAVILPLTATVVTQQFRPAAAAPVVLIPPLLPPQAAPAAVLVAPQQFRPQPAPPVFAIPVLLPSGQPVPTAPFWINPSRTQPTLAATTSTTPPPLPQAPAPIAVIAGRPQPAPAAVIALTPAPLPQAPAPITAVTGQAQPVLAAVTALTPAPLPQGAAPITAVTGHAQPALAAVIVLAPAPLPQFAAPIVVVTSTWRPSPPQVFLSQPPLAAPAVPALATAIAIVPAFPVRPGIRPLALTPNSLSHDCETPRPFTGVTTRPTGVTTRPGSGTTARPGSGTTARPNTGITSQPCD